MGGGLGRLDTSSDLLSGLPFSRALGSGAAPILSCGLAFVWLAGSFCWFSFIHWFAGRSLPLPLWLSLGSRVCLCCPCCLRVSFACLPACLLRRCRSFASAFLCLLLSLACLLASSLAYFLAPSLAWLLACCPARLSCALTLLLFVCLSPLFPRWCS